MRLPKDVIALKEQSILELLKLDYTYPSIREQLKCSSDLIKAVKDKFWFKGFSRGERTIKIQKKEGEKKIAREEVIKEEVKNVLFLKTPKQWIHTRISNKKVILDSTANTESSILNYLVNLPRIPNSIFYKIIILSNRTNLSIPESYERIYTYLWELFNSSKSITQVVTKIDKGLNYFVVKMILESKGIKIDVVPKGKGKQKYKEKEIRKYLLSNKSPEGAREKFQCDANLIRKIEHQLEIDNQPYLTATSFKKLRKEMVWKTKEKFDLNDLGNRERIKSFIQTLQNNYGYTISKIASKLKRYLSRKEIKELLNEIHSSEVSVNKVEVAPEVDSSNKNNSLVSKLKRFLGI